MGNVATYSIEKICGGLAEKLNCYNDAKKHIEGREVKFMLHELLQRLIEPQSKTVGENNFRQDSALYRLPPDAAQALANLLLAHRGMLWPELKTEIMADGTPSLGGLNNAESTEKTP